MLPARRRVTCMSCWRRCSLATASVTRPGVVRIHLVPRQGAVAAVSRPTRRGRLGTRTAEPAPGGRCRPPPAPAPPRTSRTPCSPAPPTSTRGEAEFNRPARSARTCTFTPWRLCFPERRADRSPRSCRPGRSAAGAAPGARGRQDAGRHDASDVRCPGWGGLARGRVSMISWAMSRGVAGDAPCPPPTPCPVSAVNGMRCAVPRRKAAAAPRRRSARPCRPGCSG
jgi:hypothetical protein